MGSYETPPWLNPLCDQGLKTEITLWIPLVPKGHLGTWVPGYLGTTPEAEAVYQPRTEIMEGRCQREEETKRGTNSSAEDPQRVYPQKSPY